MEIDSRSVRGNKEPRDLLALAVPVKGQAAHEVAVVIERSFVALPVPEDDRAARRIEAAVVEGRHGDVTPVGLRVAAVRERHDFAMVHRLEGGGSTIEITNGLHGPSARAADRRHLAIDGRGELAVELAAGVTT